MHARDFKRLTMHIASDISRLGLLMSAAIRSSTVFLRHDSELSELPLTSAAMDHQTAA
jgi:hypothetical protein